MKREDLQNQRFGKLIVIGYAYTNERNRAVWLCECDCGKKKEVTTGNLKSGTTRSCGCLHKEQLAKKLTTHGEYGSRLYWCWHNMKARCFNENDKRYMSYGGRGITVCEEWLVFENFRAWAMENGYADDLSIDRINVNGNYEPSNCKWSSDIEQARNKRNNRLVTYEGKTQTLKEWAEELGVNYYTLHSRIVKRGWSVERALTKGAVMYG